MTPMPPLFRRSAVLLTALLTGLLLGAAVHAATRIDLDSGWRFRTEAARAGEVSGVANGAANGAANGVTDGLAAGWHRALPNGTQPVEVPHTWGVGAEGDFEGTGWYFRRLDLPAALGAGAHVELNFGATFYRARVWLNGVPVGAHEGGHTAWAVDLGPALRRDGPNWLAVAIDNRPSDHSIPGHALRLAASRNVWYDWWHHGGITRAVWLDLSDGVLIRRQALAAELPPGTDDAPGPAQVTARVEVENTGAVARRATLVSTVFAPDGSVAASARSAVSLPAGARETATLGFTIERPVRWNVGDGQLYQVVTELQASGTGSNGRRAAPLDTRTDTLGLRRIELRDRRLWVNGRPVRLTGLSRHADSPWEGGAETRGTWLKDWDDLRALHTTLTRPIHYPQSPAVLDYADRHGVLLVPEIPIWQFSEAQLKDPRVLALAQKMMAEVIAADGNHPSIFAWSVCNECDAKLPGGLAYFRAMKAFVRAADPTRFVTFADADLSIAPWPDSAAAHEADFIMANAYFGTWSGAADQVEPWLDFMDRTYPDKAVVISEYGFPGPFARNPVEADRQRIANMRQQLDAFARRPFVAGAIFWTYQDYRSHQNLWAGETAGFVEHGVVDEHRQRKPSYAAYQQRHVPLRSELAWQAGAAGLSGFRAVLQRNAATDLPSYPLRGHRVEWRLQDRDGARVAEGAQPLPDLEAPFVLQGTWPARKDLTDAVLRLRVLAPDGAVTLETRLEPTALRFGSAVYPASPPP